MSREPLIAVIDDDDSFRVALVEALASLGYGARGFASAEHFFAGDGTGPYDCIITDVHMPRMSGFDLKRWLLAHDAGVPVIMITADAEPELEAKAAAAGAVCLLRKPFQAEAVTDRLERLLKV